MMQNVHCEEACTTLPNYSNHVALLHIQNSKLPATPRTSFMFRRHCRHVALKGQPGFSVVVHSPLLTTSSSCYLRQLLSLESRWRTSLAQVRDIPDHRLTIQHHASPSRAFRRFRSSSIIIRLFAHSHTSGPISSGSDLC